MADPVLGPVADGDTFKVIFFQSLYGQRMMNVLHYVCSDPGGTPPDRFAVCQELATYLTDTISILTDLRLVQGNDLVHTACRVQFQKEIDATYPFFQLNYSKAGTGSGNAITGNIAASIEKRAEFDPGHPRQGIGRIAVAGVPVSGIEDGLLKADYKATFNGLLEDLVDPATLPGGETLVPCLSRKGALNWIDNKIFAVTLQPQVRDMTRRTVGRGE